MSMVAEMYNANIDSGCWLEVSLSVKGIGTAAHQFLKYQIIYSVIQVLFFKNSSLSVPSTSALTRMSCTTTSLCNLEMTATRDMLLFYFSFLLFLVRQSDKTICASQRWPLLSLQEKNAPSLFLSVQFDGCAFAFLL